MWFKELGRFVIYKIALAMKFTLGNPNISRGVGIEPRLDNINKMLPKGRNIHSIPQTPPNYIDTSKVH
jgi:hypothetical protein